MVLLVKQLLAQFGEDAGVSGVVVENRGVEPCNWYYHYSSWRRLVRMLSPTYQYDQEPSDRIDGLFDPSRGYVFAGYNTQYGGEYAHLSDPKQLRYVLGDNVFRDPATGNLRELGDRS